MNYGYFKPLFRYLMGLRDFPEMNHVLVLKIGSFQSFLTLPVNSFSTVLAFILVLEDISESWRSLEDKDTLNGMSGL